jgi:hypothetical protein
MGTKCAPVLANLFLYAYESRYVDKLTVESVERARKYHNTFRFIDDTLSIDNDEWTVATSKDDAHGGIYPTELKLNDTTITRKLAHFCGMEIEGSGDKLSIQVYDKRKAFPFKVERFPHMLSLVPTSIPYGVFTGQLHRGYRICSSAQAFIEYAVELGRTMREKGCATQRLKTLFFAFARTQVHKYKGYKARFRSSSYSGTVWGTHREPGPELLDLKHRLSLTYQPQLAERHKQLIRRPES